MIKLYLAKIPNIEIKNVFCKERNDEILSCSLLSVKKEKYFVWKLLEFVLEKEFNLDYKKVKFYKNPIGKWACNKIKFSLSHSHDYVAVAVSDKEVGVDVQKVVNVCKRVIEKVVRASEIPENLDEMAKKEFAIKLWSIKESVFKQNPIKNRSVLSTDINGANVVTFKIPIDNDIYYLSACTENLENANYVLLEPTEFIKFCIK